MNDDTGEKGSAFMQDLVLGDMGESPEEEVWYVSIDGNQSGPFSYSLVNQKLQQKEIGFEDYVFKEGMDNWVQIGSLPQFGSRSPFHGSGTVKDVSTPEEAASDSNRCWYVYKSITGSQEGPYSVDEVQSQLTGGSLTFNDYVWIEQFGTQWKRIAEVPEFNRRKTTPPGGPPPVMSQSSQMPGTGGKEYGAAAPDDQLIGGAGFSDPVSAEELSSGYTGGGAPDAFDGNIQDAGSSKTEASYEALEPATGETTFGELTEGTGSEFIDAAGPSDSKGSRKGFEEEAGRNNNKDKDAGSFQEALSGISATDNPQVKSEQAGTSLKEDPVGNASSYESAAATNTVIVRGNEKEESEPYDPTNTSFSENEFTESIEGETSCSLIDVEGSDVSAESRSASVIRKDPKGFRLIMIPIIFLALALMATVLHVQGIVDLAEPLKPYIDIEGILGASSAKKGEVEETNPESTSKETEGKIAVEEGESEGKEEKVEEPETAVEEDGRAKEEKPEDEKAEEGEKEGEEKTQESEAPEKELSQEQVQEQISQLEELKDIKAKDQAIVSLVGNDLELKKLLSRELIRYSEGYKTKNQDLRYLQLTMDSTSARLKAKTKLFRYLLKTNKFSLQLFSRHDVCLGIGSLYLEQRKPRNALWWYKASLKHADCQASKVISYEKMGDLYKGRGKHRSAIKNYKRAIKNGGGESVKKKLKDSRKEYKKSHPKKKKKSLRRKSSGKKKLKVRKNKKTRNAKGAPATER